MKSTIAALLLASALSRGHAQPFIVGATDQARAFEPIVRIVLAEAGVDATFQFVPQARLITSLSSGAYQAGFFISDAGLAAIPGSRKVPVALTSVETIAITLDPSIRVASPSELGRYSVGIVRGSRISEALTSGIEAIQATDYTTLLMMLKAGRFQVAIMSSTLVPYAEEYMDGADYYIQQPPLSSTPLYFVLSSSGIARLDALTRAFRAAVDDGAWARELELITRTYE
ncbi:MAG: transporter substrate-binding domain-containing protein [Spirochaetes bacterium]|nr:transporter substrate-binding domain-containing protein [Spirochaetota bacterium]MBU1079997.1 transporter substrate-binding domain-containing protein [Spirochaetota bacterium]